MRNAGWSLRIVTAAGVAAAMAAAGQQAAGAASTGAATASQPATAAAHWSRVTSAGLSTSADIGLARGSDGTLHVLWVKGATTGHHNVVDTPISASGKIGSTATIAADQFLVTDPDATVTPSGLAAVWNGISTSSPSSPTGTFEATRPLRGGHWAVTANIPPLPGLPFTSSSDSAATGSDGKPWVAFTGSSSLAVLHIGHAEQQIPPTTCCVDDSGLATDGSTGTTWISYVSLISGHEGVFAQKLAASGGASGKPILLPKSSASGRGVPLPNQRIGITGRGKGKAGVYAIYGNAGKISRALSVIKVGTKTPATIATFSLSEQLGGATITAGPKGQMWAAWFFGDGTPPGLFVRMTGTSSATFGKTSRIALPSGTSQVLKVYINAQASKLDVLALLNRNGSTAYWATQVLPPR